MVEGVKVLTREFGEFYVNPAFVARINERRDGGTNIWFGWGSFVSSTERTEILAKRLFGEIGYPKGQGTDAA